MAWHSAACVACRQKGGVSTGQPCGAQRSGRARRSPMPRLDSFTRSGPLMLRLRQPCTVRAAAAPAPSCAASYTSTAAAQAHLRQASQVHHRRLGRGLRAAAVQRHRQHLAHRGVHILGKGRHLRQRVTSRRCGSEAAAAARRAAAARERRARTPDSVQIGCLTSPHSSGPPQATLEGSRRAGAAGRLRQRPINAPRM